MVAVVVGRRRLTERIARSCESSSSPVTSCACRCGGALHGSRRAAFDTGLPGDDPHAWRTQMRFPFEQANGRSASPVTLSPAEARHALAARKFLADCTADGLDPKAIIKIAEGWDG